MLQYIAYVGPKDSKRVQNDSQPKRWVEFSQGQTVDAIEAGFSPARIKFLLKSGVFQLRASAANTRTVVVNESKESEAMEYMQPPRNICGCGFVAKSKAGLVAHKRHCEA